MPKVLTLTVTQCQEGVGAEGTSARKIHEEINSFMFIILLFFHGHSQGNKFSVI